MEKFYPEVGTPLYLSQRTGSYYADMVKNPYTVIGVKGGKVQIQECKLIFNGPRYYDTIADEILPDSEGEILELNWAPKKEMWQVDKYKTGYPDYAFFGRYEHFPYMD